MTVCLYYKWQRIMKKVVCVGKTQNPFSLFLIVLHTCRLLLLQWNVLLWNLDLDLSPKTKKRNKLYWTSMLLRTVFFKTYNLIAFLLTFFASQGLWSVKDRGPDHNHWLVYMSYMIIQLFLTPFKLELVQFSHFKMLLSQIKFDEGSCLCIVLGLSLLPFRLCI